MLDILFGSKNAERVLQYLCSKESGYTREISDFYNVSPSVIKKQLDKFEASSIIVGKKFANIRIYELNQRYPFYEELVQLLKKARSTYPDKERIRLTRKIRNRPRSNGKPLEMRSNEH